VAWQKVRIKIPEGFTPDERFSIGEKIVEFIRQRSTEKKLDKNNRPLAKYSKGYENSLDFKIAGKSKGRANLKLSGDMLAALDVLSTTKDSVLIGFQNGSEENGKAEGNILGTYGQPTPIPGKKRDFLGLTKSDLNKILALQEDDDDSTN
jgi:hypothetical protein